MMVADLQQRRVVGYYVSARTGRSGEKSAIRGNRKIVKRLRRALLFWERKGGKKWKL